MFFSTLIYVQITISTQINVICQGRTDLLIQPMNSYHNDLKIFFIIKKVVFFSRFVFWFSTKLIFKCRLKRGFSGSSLKLWTSWKAIIMNKWYIVLIFISLVSIPSFSQEITPASIESFTPNSLKFNPVLSSENFRFSGKSGTHWKNNNNGEFYLTNNGGRTWTTMYFNSSYSFVIPSGGERWYCFAGGRLYKTDTGGIQWGVYDLPDPDVKEMQFVTTFSGVYITNTGVLYQTTNPSEGWVMKLNHLSTSAKLFANANAVYVTDSTNSIYFSKDMGKNFKKLPPLFNNPINNARFINGLSYVGSVPVHQKVE